MSILLNPACDSCSCTGTVSTYVGGRFTTVGGQSAVRLARLLASGALDPTFSVSVTSSLATARVTSMVLDGTTLYIGGLFDTVGGSARTNLAAIDTTSGSVTSWTADTSAGGGSDEVNCLLLIGSTLYVGGSFTTVLATARNNSAAVSTAGVLQSWTANTNNTVLGMATDGTDIYMCGSFTTVAGGTTRNRVAAFDTGGSLLGWNPNISTSGTTARTITVSGGVVYFGGNFTTVAGQNRRGAAAVDTAGTLQSWDPSLRALGGVNAGNVRVIVVDGSTVYIGGSFIASNSETRNHAAALDTSGTLLPWNPNVTPTASAGSDFGVHSMFVEAGLQYFVGEFTAIGGLTRNSAAVINEDGDLFDWNPNLGSASPDGQSIIAA